MLKQKRLRYFATIMQLIASTMVGVNAGLSIYQHFPKPENPLIVDVKAGELNKLSDVYQRIIK